MNFKSLYNDTFVKTLDENNILDAPGRKETILFTFFGSFFLFVTLYNVFWTIADILKPHLSLNEKRDIAGALVSMT